MKTFFKRPMINFKIWNKHSVKRQVNFTTTKNIEKTLEREIWSTPTNSLPPLTPFIMPHVSLSRYLLEFLSATFRLSDLHWSPSLSFMSSIFAARGLSLLAWLILNYFYPTRSYTHIICYYCRLTSTPSAPCSPPPPGGWACAALTAGPPPPRSGGGTMRGNQSAMHVDSIISCMELTDLSPWGKMGFRQGRGNPRASKRGKKKLKQKVRGC